MATSKEEIKELDELKQEIEKLIGEYNDTSQKVGLGSKLALLEGAFTFSLGDSNWQPSEDEEYEKDEDTWYNSGCAWQSSYGCSY